MLLFHQRTVWEESSYGAAKYYWLIPERVEEFSKMFNDRVRSFDEAVQHEDLKYTSLIGWQAVP